MIGSRRISLIGPRPLRLELACLAKEKYYLVFLKEHS